MLPLLLMVVGQPPDSAIAGTIVCVHVLESARQHYEQGAYTRAITELESLLSRFNGTNGCDERVAVDTYVLLALNYVAVGDKSTAIEHFKKALIREPRLLIDRYEPAPEVAAVFEEARKEQAYESAGCSCLIPGAGQFMRGDDFKGGMVIAGTVISLAGTVISWSIADGKYNQYVSLGPDEIDLMDEVYDEYNRWWKTTIVSGGVLLGIYVYSIVDAMIAERPATVKAPPDGTGFLLEYDGERVRIGYALNP